MGNFAHAHPDGHGAHEEGPGDQPSGTATAKKKRRRFTDAAKQREDLEAWRRGRAVLGYIDGRRVSELAMDAE